MALKVKIDVYILRFKRHGKEEYANINEFVFVNPKTEEKVTSDEDNFIKLFRTYIQSFDSGFFVQKSSDERYTGGKGIHLIEEQVKINKDERLIYGRVRGGSNDGLGSVFVDVDDPLGEKETSFVKDRDKFETLQFYFMLWLPNELNQGLLIVQGFGGKKTIASLFVKHFQKFVHKGIAHPKVSLSYSRKIEKEWKEGLVRNGVITNIVFEAKEFDQDRAGNLFMDDIPNTNASYSIVFQKMGYLKRLRERVLLRLQGKPVSFYEESSLAQYGITSLKDVVVEIEYQGKSTKVKQSKAFKIENSYYLDDEEVERDENNYPTMESMFGICMGIIEKHKRDIRYEDVLEN